MSEPSRARSRLVDLAAFAALFGVGLGLFAWRARHLPLAPVEAPRLALVRELSTWIVRVSDDPRAALDPAAVDRAFRNAKGVGHLLPALGGWLHAAMAKAHVASGDATAQARAGAVVVGALVPPLAYAFARVALGRVAALVAALVVLVAPAYAEAAVTSGPGCAADVAWLLVAIPALASLDGPRKVASSLAAGAAFGVAAGLSSAALWLPVVVVCVALATRSAHARSPDDAGRVEVPASLAFMALAGVPLLVALSPWLWRDASLHVRDTLVTIASAPSPGATSSDAPPSVLAAMAACFVVAGALALAFALVDRRAPDGAAPGRAGRRAFAAWSALLAAVALVRGATGHAFAAELPALLLAFALFAALVVDAGASSLAAKRAARRA